MLRHVRSNTRTDQPSELRTSAAGDIGSSHSDQYAWRRRPVASRPSQKWLGHPKRSDLREAICGHAVRSNGHLMADIPAETLEDALVQAVCQQDLAAVQSLLAAGANPNRRGGAWSSAIACAGENDETGEIIRTLVAAGADLHLPDEQGQTPLHWAVDVAIDGAAQAHLSEIRWDVVGVLLDLGASLERRDRSGRTVLDLITNAGDFARQSFEDFVNARRPSPGM